jgi:glycosyltransferase involved in cell wall biosynthesis
LDTTAYSLSFIISTKNRLPFLKILLAHLLPQLKPDEEVVVVDGNSSDGSAEFLEGLFTSGKIHQFISEPDQNQAHGWNKALLMAKGTIIKKLIDDDVPDIRAIRKCRDLMLANADIDICLSNHLESSLANPDAIGTTGRLSYYLQWKNNTVNTFTFSDVSILQRRSSLSFLGLYDTQFKMLDWEYSLRITYFKAKIAYYTGYNSLAVTTPGNVSSTTTKKQLQKEENIGKLKYGYSGDGADISFYSRIKIWIGSTIYHLKNPRKTYPVLNLPPENALEKIYSSYYKRLEDQNNAGDWEFIF